MTGNNSSAVAGGPIDPASARYSDSNVVTVRGGNSYASALGTDRQGAEGDTVAVTGDHLAAKVGAVSDQKLNCTSATQKGCLGN